MRTLHSAPKEGKPPRAKKEGPLEEGALGQKANKKQTPMPYTEEDINYIKKRRGELISTGLTDNEISRVIKKETGRPAGSTENKIRELCEKGTLPPNPNKREKKEFAPQKVELILAMREELILQGLNDTEISKKVGQATGRCWSAVSGKISDLCKEGKIRANPNKQEQKDFTEHEIHELMRRYEELVQAGMKNGQIAGKIEEETGRKSTTVQSMLLRLSREGKIRGNPNKLVQNYFSEQESDALIRRYSELVQTGMKDVQIAKRIGEETGRSSFSVLNKIRILSKQGKIPKNLATIKKEHFTPQEERMLIKRREELIAEGFTDSQVADKIGREIGRPKIQLESKILRLLKDEVIPDNPNKKCQKRFSEEEERELIRKREALIAEGMTDTMFSYKLGKETGRHPSSLRQKIVLLLKEGKIRENPNRHSSYRNMGDEELLSYARAYLAEKGISKRSDLVLARGGLYNALSRRGLLEEVFSDIEAAKHAEIRGKAVDAVLEVLGEMGDSK